MTALSIARNNSGENYFASCDRSRNLYFNLFSSLVLLYVLSIIYSLHHFACHSVVKVDVKKDAFLLALVLSLSSIIYIIYRVRYTII